MGHASVIMVFTDRLAVVLADGDAGVQAGLVVEDATAIGVTHPLLPPSRRVTVQQLYHHLVVCTQR